MKKILILVLCFVCCFPAVSEGKDDSFPNVAMEDCTSELCIELGAYTAQRIFSVGDGYFVKWDTEIAGLQVYIPNVGWKKVDFSEMNDAVEGYYITSYVINADTARMEIDKEYMNYLVDMDNFGEWMIGRTDVVLTFPVRAVLGDGFIMVYLKCGWAITIDIIDMKAHFIVDYSDFCLEKKGKLMRKADVEMDDGIINEMYIVDHRFNYDYSWTTYEEDVEEWFDVTGGMIGKVNISKLKAIDVFDIFCNETGYVVYYKTEGENRYKYKVAWIGFEGDILQDVEFEHAGQAKGILYSKERDIAIYHSAGTLTRCEAGEADKYYIACRDGSVDLLFFDYDTSEFEYVSQKDVVFQENPDNGRLVSMTWDDMKEQYTDQMMGIKCILNDGRNILVGTYKYVYLIDIETYDYKKIEIEEKVANILSQSLMCDGEQYITCEAGMISFAIK